MSIPGGTAVIDHFPRRGRFKIAGDTRAHLAITYRSDEDNGLYLWSSRAVGSGDDTQHIPIGEPAAGRAMRDFPALLAAARIEIEPRHAGFARYQGDIGGEALTVIQGVVYAEEEIRLHGSGGWAGGPVVFDEREKRRGDDALSEAVLNVDLNGDAELYDTVELSAISTVPVIAVGSNAYNVDLNNDGVLGELTIGDDYLKFFHENDFAAPVLIYQEGVVLGRSIHSCEQVRVVCDRQIARSGVPFGFEVTFGSSTYQGLVAWWERNAR